MKKPPRGMVVAVVVPFLIGCYGVLMLPVPGPGEARPSGIRGVIVEDGAEGERVEFSRTDHVQWTDSSIALTGELSTGTDGTRGRVVTRTFPLASLRGVLVRQVDANKTSILISAGVVGIIAAVALVISGETTDSTVLNPPPPGLIR